MFLGQIFAKNAKNDPKTLFEASKSVISYKTIDCSSKTALVVAIPVNTYFQSKSAEHDVTLTSFVADL